MNTLKEIPLPILNNTGDHYLQTALFFKKRLYLGATSYPNGLSAPGISRILQYYPSAERWETVHETSVESPLMHGNHSRRFPLELGWRAMQVMPSSAGTEVLCITCLSLHHSQLLFTEDGIHFKTLPNPGEVQPHSAPFGLLYHFGDWLFAAPTGVMSDGITEKNDGGALLYVNRDPLTENWRLANSPGFGDPHNQVVHGLHAFHGWLYAMVGNPFAGFQLWRTQARGEPPFTWEPVLQQGAYRYTLNSTIAAIAVFKGMLYLGTGVPETDPLLDNATGSEIIRVLPNGRWELVVGQPRFSPTGLQVPISTLGPGFNDTRNTLVSALASSTTTLYAAVVQRDSDGAVGFQVWQTANGENWQPLTSPKFTFNNACSLRVLLTMSRFLLAAGTWRFDNTDTTHLPCLWVGQSE